MQKIEFLELLRSIYAYCLEHWLYIVLPIGGYLVLWLIASSKRGIGNWWLKRRQGRNRILIVDDEEFAFARPLEEAGYKIRLENDIDRPLLGEILEGKYFLVMLDIKGVGKTLGFEDSLGLLEHIKDKRPSQKVILFSCNDYNLREARIIELADAKIDKLESLKEFENAIEKFYLEGFEKSYRVINLLPKFLKFGRHITD